MKILHANDEDKNVRIDVFVAQSAEITRSAAQRMIENGLVLIDEKAVRKNYKMLGGEDVTLLDEEQKPSENLPEDIPLEIVYEDSDIAVINKASGMVVHPAVGNESGTLVNALLFHCKDLSGIGGELRPGIVHRIDKDTSGLLVIAKNNSAHIALAAQLKGHHIDRIYYALAVGKFRRQNGVVNEPIGRHPVDRKRMAVIKSGVGAREAITNYEVLEELGGYSYIKLKLETGRTHQIRVHMAYIGHPLMGDLLYGGGSTRFEKQNGAHIHGQMLHAGELNFVHPRTGEQLHFECPPPDDFTYILEKLRRVSK